MTTEQKIKLRDAREKFNDHVNECEHCTGSMVDGDDLWCRIGDELNSRAQAMNAAFADGDDF